jgi:hypothetical protein
MTTILILYAGGVLALSGQAVIEALEHQSTDLLFTGIGIAVTWPITMGMWLGREAVYFGRRAFNRYKEASCRTST